MVLLDNTSTPDHTEASVQIAQSQSYNTHSGVILQVSWICGHIIAGSAAITEIGLAS